MGDKPRPLIFRGLTAKGRVLVNISCLVGIAFGLAVQWLLPLVAGIVITGIIPALGFSFGGMLVGGLIGRSVAFAVFGKDDEE